MVAAVSYTEPEQFELLVGARTAAGYPLTVLQSPAGEANALCRLDPGDGELQDALQSIADQNADAAFLSEVGGFLFGELFAGEVGDLLAASLNTVRVQSARLCIRLRFERPEMAALPWELLHNPGETSFLAISPETAVVRFVPLRLPVRPTAVKPPLRILVVIASPHDLAPLDVLHEKRLIHDALYEHIRSGLNRQETRQLAAVRGLTLPEHLIDLLHRHIEGNAELLNIAIEALRHTDAPGQLLDSLARAESIERFLLDRLDKQLAEAERKVESAVAVLGYPSTRAAIETVLQQTGLERTIYGLWNASCSPPTPTGNGANMTSTPSCAPSIMNGPPTKNAARCTAAPPSIMRARSLISSAPPGTLPAPGMCNGRRLSAVTMQSSII